MTGACNQLNVALYRKNVFTDNDISICGICLYIAIGNYIGTVNNITGSCHRLYIIDGKYFTFIFNIALIRHRFYAIPRSDRIFIQNISLFRCSNYIAFGGYRTIKIDIRCLISLRYLCHNIPTGVHIPLEIEAPGFSFNGHISRICSNFPGNGDSCTLRLQIHITNGMEIFSFFHIEAV